MPEILQKLQPDRDLQCYFFHPSAIAALSGASPTGFTLSGTWRQQFDWAVVEWNRDNTFEHPALRYLPDGDLSGLKLSYVETRTNCIPLDSALFPTVDWPSLRIWADNGSGEQVYKIPLAQHATAVAGGYTCATASITLDGTVTTGDVAGFALPLFDQHFAYIFRDGDILENAVQAITDAVNTDASPLRAVRNGRTVTLTYVGVGQTAESSTIGANGNRLGLYTYVKGAETESWNVASAYFSEGASPSAWRIDIDFSSLTDPQLGPVPTQAVRKLRWTYSADLQNGPFERSEFAVEVTNWTVTGTGREYHVAGPGSWRYDDDAAQVQFSGGWVRSTGNFYGGSIHTTVTPNDSVQCSYSSEIEHDLYLGTRCAFSGTTIHVSIDGGSPQIVDLLIPGEDVLTRKHLGRFGPGAHVVTAVHAGNVNEYFYFDFLEIANPTTELPIFPVESKVTLATDWDTDHSIALAPERTAWFINTLGFRGRANHYAGALWFYELTCPGVVYAATTVTFAGAPDENATTEITVQGTQYRHLNVIGETAATLAKSFELHINSGSTGIRAQANGNILTIYALAIGVNGNNMNVAITQSTENLNVQLSSPVLTGGLKGKDEDWRTDLSVVPRLNRAARDWTQAFLAALKAYGLDAAVSFSTELQHADPTLETGIVQRYASGQAVLLNTPAYQTNFSPVSLAFWQQVYADMAKVMTEAGVDPYLQFGEVQWWYFPEKWPDDKMSGMTFYDAYTTSQFKSKYGRDMATLLSNDTDPATVPDEAAFLPTLIGEHTNGIMQFVRSTYPNCRFEVLYPLDVNDFALTRVANYPRDAWTPATLTCLKTESFGFTFARDLNLCLTSIDAGVGYGFPPSQRSHLIGISDSYSPWLKEIRLSQAAGLESVVLWALDQFCLIGYPVPMKSGLRRVAVMG